MLTILFVCAVNRFRSVIGEYRLNEILSRRKDNLNLEIEVTSAGIGLSADDIELLEAEGKFWREPVFGLPPYPYAIASMRRRGLDISNSRSKELTREMVNKADLIIAFEDSQKQIILSPYNAVTGRVFTLQELVGYTGYLVNTDYSFPGAKPNPETRSWTFPDSFLEASITEIEHMLWWGIDRFVEMLWEKNDNRRRGIRENLPAGKALPGSEGW